MVLGGGRQINAADVDGLLQGKKGVVHVRQQGAQIPSLTRGRARQGIRRHELEAAKGVADRSLEELQTIEKCRCRSAI
jgi:hypothetical protein